MIAPSIRRADTARVHRFTGGCQGESKASMLIRQLDTFGNESGRLPEGSRRTYNSGK